MLPVARVIGHKEWTPRKPDPRLDMAWRRARVAAFTPRAGTTQPIQEDDMSRHIAAHGRGHAVVAPGYVKYLANGEEVQRAIQRHGGFEMLSTRDFDLDVALNFNGVSAPVPGKADGVDLAELAKKVATDVTASVTAQLVAQVREVVGAALGEDNAAQAGEIVDLVAERLTAPRGAVG